VGAVAALASRRVGIAVGGRSAVKAGGVLLLLGGVTGAAGDRREFLRVRYLFYIGVAGGAVDPVVRGCLQGRGIVSGGHAGLAAAGARSGIVAPSAVFSFKRWGFGCWWLLGGERGGEGQGGRREAKAVAA